MALGTAKVLNLQRHGMRAPNRLPDRPRGPGIAGSEVRLHLSSACGMSAKFWTIFDRTKSCLIMRKDK